MGAAGDADQSSPRSVEEGENSIGRHMGLMAGTSLIAGYVIGSGIFAAPGDVYTGVDSAGVALILWIFGGLFATCGALSYAELGVLFPKNGADQVYHSEAFHPILGMGFSISNIMFISPAVEAATASIFGKYLYTMIHYDPNLGPDDQAAISPDDMTPQWLGILIITLVCLLNMAHKKAGSQIQTVFTVAKLLGLALVVVLGIVVFAKGQASDPLKQPFQSNSNRGFLDYVDAFIIGMFAYTGFNNLNAAAGELKNPRRNLPLAIVLSMATLTVIYTLANVGYFAVLTADQIKTSKAVAQLQATVAIGPVGAYIMSLAVILSTTGAVNGAAIGHSRFIMAAAEENLWMPKFCGRISRRGSPAVALLMNIVITSVVLLAFKDFAVIGRITSFAQFIYYATSCLAVIRLRQTRPDAERAFRLPLAFPILFVLVALLINVLALYNVKDFENPLLLAFGYGSALFLLFPFPALVYYLRVGRSNPAPMVQYQADDSKKAPAVFDGSAVTKRDTQAALVAQPDL